MVNIHEINNIIQQFQSDLSQVNNTLSSKPDMDVKQKKELLKMMNTLNKIISILHSYKDLLAIK